MVNAVATGMKSEGTTINFGFNTVNGKCCCNLKETSGVKVSPWCFNTVNGKHCCNSQEQLKVEANNAIKFQYRKR